MDVRATILGFLGIWEADGGGGISLKHWMYGLKKDALDRTLFLEAGFSLPGVEDLTPVHKAMLSKGVTHYEVQENGLLTMTDVAADISIENTQFDGW